MRDWKPAWRKPDPKPSYDVIIVGGGGHGLSTAYYLAKEHGITNVAVLEKGYLGSGNVGRNTTIVRSNYLLPGTTRFYEHVDEAVGGSGAGPELQCHVLAARRATSPFTRCAARCDYAGAATPCAMRASTPNCSMRGRSRLYAGARLRPFRRRAFRSWRPDAAARRHGPARCGRLGLCARRRPARRRHHPELRGDRLPQGRRPSSASRRRAARSAKKVGARRRRQFRPRR
jgi:hypothetical protein